MLKRPVNVTSSLFTKTRAWPSAVRLNAHPSDKYIKVLLIDDAGYEHVVFHSSDKLRDGIELSGSMGMLEVVQRDYAIPSARFTVKVETSKRKYAGGSRASMQFLVNGQWTPPQKFQRGIWSPGAVLEKDYETQAWPSQVRLINDCTDAWGYKRIVVLDPSGHEHVVLDSSNGARYGDNEFWLDGDEIQVSQRDFDVPSRMDEL